jgi:hypothetical protein
MKTPYIYLDNEEVRMWEGKTLSQLHEEHEHIAKEAKKAVGYPYDNTHYVLTGYTHEPQVKVLFSTDSISFWAFKSDRALKSVCLTGTIWTRKDTEELRRSIEKVQCGYLQCGECNQWWKAERMKDYSFAGTVCPQCYDPAKHLPPDTRGD